MKQFLESLIKSIVENPDSVEINESQDDKDRQLLTIKVAPDDMGRVIGKSGKVINSVRTIMRVVAIRQGVRVRVDVEDDNPPAPDSKPETKEAPKDQPDPVETKEPTPETDGQVAQEAETSPDNTSPTPAELVKKPTDDQPGS